MIVKAERKEEVRLRNEVRAQQALQVLSEQSVGTAGLDLTVSWRPALGATDAVVESAWIDLWPVSGSDPGQSAPASMSPNGNAFDVVLDGPARPVRSVRLNGLKAAGIDRELKSEADVTGLAADLPGPTWRLCVAVDPGSGFGLVQYALPFIGQRGQRPAMLVGARFDGRVLQLPDVPAKKLRVSLMRGELPEDFADQGASLSSAAVRVAPGPVDLEVSDASGPLWSVPGPFTEGVRIDLKNSVTRAFNEDPAAASATVTLKGSAAGRLLSGGVRTSGHLLRKFDDKVQASFEGNSQPLPLGELDARAPIAANADVTVVHEGLRLHPISRDLPAASGGLSGRVVDAAPSVWTLAPEALRGEKLVRVGVVGFGQSGELGLRVLEAAGETTGQPVDEAFAKAEIGETPGGGPARVTWLVLAKPLGVDRSIAIELTATGRFLWVEEDGQPIVRFAVACETQGSVTIGGKDFSISGKRTELTDQTLPASVFAIGPVMAATDQFCRLTLSRLRLRYRP